MIILARRLTIITLAAAIFAITFSAAVEHSGRHGLQARSGSAYTCLHSIFPHCGQAL